jgi:hypothetical protein
MSFCFFVLYLNTLQKNWPLKSQSKKISFNRKNDSPLLRFRIPITQISIVVDGINKKSISVLKGSVFEKTDTSTDY